MSPRESLLDRIAALDEQARVDRPDGEHINRLLADIRVYFGAIGTQGPPAKVDSVNAGSFEDARRLYSPGR